MTSTPRRRRLARGIAANIFALASRVLVQLALLPVLFAAWPAERVGSWLTLFALPAYIALVGNAFAGAGGSAALAAAQAGDWDRARADFRVASSIALAGTLALAIAFAAGGGALALHFADGLAGVGRDELRPAFAWLALYILAVSQAGALEIVFRVAGRYPTHIVLMSLAGLLEVALVMALVEHETSVAELAMILTLARVAIAVPSTIKAWRVAPQLFSRGPAPMRASMRDLWRPSIALMLVPLIFGLNLQGYVLLVGASFGALGVAAFSATRTLVRVLDFLVNLAYGVQYFEAGYETPDGAELQRRQLATMTLVMLLLSLLYALMLEVLGPWLQSLYTLGATGFDRSAAAVLLLAGGMRALAATPMALIVASNRHERIIGLYLACSALALGLAAGLALLDLPLAVVLSPLLLAEASQTIPAFTAALRKLDMDWRQFAAALRSRERLEDLALAGRFVRLRR